MAGTPEKMLEHLLESRLDNRNETEIGKQINYVNILCPMGDSFSYLQRNSKDQD